MDLHALLPRLISKTGHIFPYHIALQRAVQSIGWRYHAYTPKKTDISPLPSCWKAVLANDLSETPKSIGQMLIFFLTNVFPFRKIFQEIENKDSSVVFIEHFELHHLASIAFALIFLRPKFDFWILHRYELEGKKLKGSLCRIFLRYMRWKLGTKKVKCFTDSDLLSKSLEVDLHCPIYVLPIPHTEGKWKGQKRHQEGNQLWWWPGGLIREEKGLCKIQLILDRIKDNTKIQVVIAEKGRDFFGARPNIHFVKTFLSRDEYIEWMQKSDLILLPYLQKDYSHRTSGIFVEAIILGSIPIVTRGTWMAYELMKFDLIELIFQWDENDLIDRLHSIAEDFKIQMKLEKMRTDYRQFHSENGFAALLQHYLDK